MVSAARLAVALFIAVVAGAVLYTYSGGSTPTEGSRRLLATPLDPTTVLTNPNRTDNVAKYCSVPRSQMIADSDRTVNQQFTEFMKTKFDLDPMPLVQSLLSFNLGAIMMVLPTMLSSLTNFGIGLGITVGPFLIGLILSLTLWSCLLCCCVCPGACPSKCCQHSDGELYTKCELIWPAIVLLVFMVMACAASVPGIQSKFNVGFIQVGKVTDGLKSAECAISIMLDDALNGNLTNDNSSLFIGTVQLSQQLTALSSATGLTAFATALTPLGASAPTLLTATATTNGALNLFPSGTAGVPLSIPYSDPTPRTTTGTTIMSSIGGVLGTSSTSGSLCRNAFEAVRNLDISMTTMTGAATALGSAIPTMVTDLSTVAPSVATLVTSIQGMDSGTGALYASIEGYLGYIQTGLTVFYSLVFALTGVTALGGCCMIILNKDKFRYVMYGACAVMAIIAILGMLVSFVISLVSPFLYMGCNALTGALSDSTAFLALTGAMMLPPDVTNTLSQCLPGGSGSVLAGFGATGSSLSTQFTSAFNALNLMTASANYDPTPISTAQSNIGNTLSQFTSSAQNDITHDSQSLTWFQGLAAGTLPSACSSDAIFRLDSLVPSTASSSLANIPCAAGIGVVACANFGTCPPGCIDLNSVMTSAGSIPMFQSQITTRYSSAGAACQTAIYNDLSMYYTNWYTTMAPAMTAVNGGWTATISPSITTVLGSLTPVQTQLNTALSGLNTAVPKITDPVNGIQNGLNCLTLGEDLVRVKEALCINVFNGLFVSLVTVGLSAFSLLLSMCCIVCTGVRYYKQGQMIKANEEKQLKKSKAIGEREQTMMSINEM